MITTMQMYWLVMLDSIHVASMACLAVSLVVSFTSAGVALDMKGRWRLPKLTAAIAILFLLMATFIPSTKQMAAIMVVPKLANSEKVQTVGNQLYDLAVEWMEELRPKKERK